MKMTLFWRMFKIILDNRLYTELVLLYSTSPLIVATSNDFEKIEKGSISRALKDRVLCS
jgi:hypothetical protein